MAGNAFQLDHDRHAAVTKSSVSLQASARGRWCRRCCRARISAAVRCQIYPSWPASRFEVAVVKNDRIAVARQAHVAFDRIVLFDRRGRRPTACFPRPRVHIVLAAMRDRPLCQPGIARSSVAHATSMIGFDLDRRVERQRRHADSRARMLARSPRTATKKSDAPLATRCCSVKSGVGGDEDRDLDDAPDLFERSPSAALACARTLTAQYLAASLPAAVSTSRPSRPVDDSLPSLSGNWPAVKSRLPLLANGT